MTTKISHFIDGQRTAGQSKRTADVMNPNTGQVQATVPMASVADVDAAVAVAVEAQKEWAAFNPQRRARVMMRFVDLVNQNIDELAETLSLEHGKTVEDSKGDVQRGIEVIEFAVGIPHLIKGEYTEGAGTGIDVYSLRQPLGVVAGITPFNFPAMIPLWKAGPALACGNAFILKPSERDPSVPVRLAELFLEAGLPKGVFQVVHGDKEAVDAILDHPEIKAVGFVGSSDIAQYIYSTAAANGKRAQCFGGAKNHMIVMPDADLDNAVDALIGAGYGSAGERCMAISVAVPVGEQTAERLRARLVERVNELRVGHSLDPKADLRPVGHRGRVGAGARLHRPGRRGGRRSRRRRPGPQERRPAVRRRQPGRGLLHRPDAVRPRHAGHVDLHRRDLRSGVVHRAREGLRGGASRCRPSTNTATAWRFSPATATPHATSCPACRSAWSA